MKKRIGWYGIVWICIGILAIYIVAGIIRATCFNRWKVKPYERIELPYCENLAENCTRNELKVWVDNLFNTPHFVVSTSKKSQNWASSSCLFRVVFISKAVKGEKFVLQYAHELAHLKFCNVNDTYIAFKTFEMLYESKNEVLVNVAKRYARDMITFGGYENTRYDCGFYILEYLKKGE